MKISDIKFRAKKLITGEWLYGWLYCHSGRYFIMCNDNEEQIDPETVGQYVGNYGGVDVFSGDIVKHKFRRVWQTDWHTSKVEWNKEWACYYLVQQFANQRLRDDVIYEVIGNIHDNSDLIK